jgi:broad specificity phosphatase PhoE
VTTFHLVRHAEKSDRDVLAGRAPGVLLSETGRTQASRLAALFTGIKVDHLFASPLERAQETATPLAHILNLRIAVTPEFDEMDLGRFSGRTPADLQSDDAWQRFNRFRSGYGAPGGETMWAVQSRVVGALMRWREELPDAQIIVVSHAEPIRAALLYFLGAPLDYFLRLDIPLASVSTLELSTAHARITRVGATVPNA